MKTDLSLYTNSWYRPGPRWKIALWILVSSLFFSHSLAIGSRWKCFLLRLFGAMIGEGVIIKPSVSIKYPWFLTIGRNVWIGEKVWIDNLANVKIGNNVCISQGAFLLTGNHNYSRSSFDLSIKPIIIEDGVWIGARAIVCPGMYCESQSVLTVQSVATKRMVENTIYQGNPAIPVKERIIIQ